METVTIKRTIFEVYNEFGVLMGRYSDRHQACSDIWAAKRSFSPLSLSSYTIEERTVEETFEVFYKKFRKNSVYEDWRGKTVKFLAKNGWSVYSEVDGVRDYCNWVSPN